MASVDQNVTSAGGEGAKGGGGVVGGGGAFPVGGIRSILHNGEF